MIKNYISLFLLLTFVLLTYRSNGQCPDELIISNQVDVELFAINYPDCEYLDSDLVINGPATDLTFLSGLKSVKNIFIRNSLLTSLQGLENIEEAQSLTFINNQQLESLNFLFKINKVNSLTIQQNSALTSLAGLSIDSIQGNFSFRGNANITSFVGLQSIRHIGGRLEITSSRLETLEGLQQLNTIENGFTLENNNHLINVDGFLTLDTIKNDIRITNNIQLNNLDGLAFGQFSGHTIEISDNLSLNSCAIDMICNAISDDNVTLLINSNGDQCSTIPIAEACDLPIPECPFGVVIQNEDEYSVFRDSFPNCTYLTGNFFLQNYAGELPVDAFDHLISINGRLSLRNLDMEIPHFQNLTSVHSVDIRNNIIPNDLNILNSLISCENGGVTIQLNELNGEQSGFSSLEKVTSSITFILNQGVNVFNAFNQLDSIDRDLRFTSNTDLVTISGFQSLKSIGRNLQLIGNDSLRYLDAFDKPIDMGAILIIEDNPSLSVCHVEAVCVSMLESVSIAIFDNADGCQSFQEVRNACLTSTDDIINHADLKIYPNPFPDALQIENNDSEGDFHLLDIHGRVIWSHTIPAGSHETYTLSTLPSGQYMYHFTTANRHKSGTLIKK